MTKMKLASNLVVKNYVISLSCFFGRQRTKLLTGHVNPVQIQQNKTSQKGKVSFTHFDDPCSVSVDKR